MIQVQTDILIIGAGIAGISAAVKAGRLGAQVILIERYPFLGGMATVGMVSPFMRHTVGDQSLVNGIFADIQSHMRSHQGMVDNGFSTEAFRFAVINLLEEANVKVLTQCELVKVDHANAHITTITVSHAGILKSITPQVVIDTSGDAQVSHLSGFQTMMGREKDHVSQAMTLFFRMGGIEFAPILKDVRARPHDFFEWVNTEPDENGIIAVAGYYEAVKQAHEKGVLSPTIKYLFFASLPGSGEASFNTTSVMDLKATSSKDLTQAERYANAQVQEIVALLKAEISGFEKAYLLETATQIGVRESRRMIGERVMFADSIRSGEKFDDRIARGCYGVDIHGNSGEDDIMEELAEDAWYDIPKDCLLSKDVDNLLGAGKCISADFEAHGALRIMPTSAATGEAAGAWAALAIKNGSELRDVGTRLLQDQIRDNLGA